MTLKFGRKGSSPEPSFAWLSGKHETYSHLRKKIKRADNSGEDWRVGIDWEGHEGTHWNDGHAGENVIL